MVFHPSIEIGDLDGFLDIWDTLATDIYRQSTCIDRLSAHDPDKPDYMVSDIKWTILNIMSNFKNTKFLIRCVNECCTISINFNTQNELYLRHISLMGKSAY